MDVKEPFDHGLRTQLFKQIIELSMDEDLVVWTSSFLPDRKIQLVIDGHENAKREIETEISQRSLVSPILFLIYISRVFVSVLKKKQEPPSS